MNTFHFHVFVLLLLNNINLFITYVKTDKCYKQINIVIKIVFVTVLNHNLVRSLGDVELAQLSEKLCNGQCQHDKVV